MTFDSIAIARAIAATALPSLCAVAAAEPFPDADLANGEAIHAERCVACHTEKTGRDAAYIYRRDDHKVRTLFDLRRTVSLCDSQLQLGLFPQDERDVAAYLNRHFYKLTQ